MNKSGKRKTLLMLLPMLFLITAVTAPRSADAVSGEESFGQIYLSSDPEIGVTIVPEPPEEERPPIQSVAPSDPYIPELPPVQQPTTEPVPIQPEPPAVPEPVEPPVQEEPPVPVQSEEPGPSEESPDSPDESEAPEQPDAPEEDGPAQSDEPSESDSPDESDAPQESDTPDESPAPDQSSAPSSSARPSQSPSSGGGSSNRPSQSGGGSSGSSSNRPGQSSGGQPSGGNRPSQSASPSEGFDPNDYLVPNTGTPDQETEQPSGTFVLPEEFPSSDSGETEPEEGDASAQNTSGAGIPTYIFIIGIVLMVGSAAGFIALQISQRKAEKLREERRRYSDSARKPQAGAPVRAAGQSQGNVFMHLDVISGTYATRSKDFYLMDELIIGRGSHCDIAWRDEEVSPRNTRIFLSGNIVCIEDMGSQCGTALNNTKIHTASRLHGGDVVSIGPVRFRLRF